MSSSGNPKYWFPAKRHGWGWGAPVAWQGWAVLVVYIGLLVGGIPLIQVAKGDLAYLMYACALTVALIAVCWVTGEPPDAGRHRRDD